MVSDPPEIEAIYRAIGARVCMIRETLDVTQAVVAKRAGVSRPALVNMEVGRQRISLHKLEALAEALGTTPKGLMKGIWW